MVEATIKQSKLDTFAQRLSDASGQTWRCTNYVEPCSTNDIRAGGYFEIDDANYAKILSQPRVKEIADAVPPEIATISLFNGQTGSGNIPQRPGIFVESDYLSDARPIARLMIALRPLMQELGKSNIQNNGKHNGKMDASSGKIDTPSGNDATKSLSRSKFGAGL